MFSDRHFRGSLLTKPHICKDFAAKYLNVSFRSYKYVAEKGDTYFEQGKLTDYLTYNITSIPMT